MPAESPRNNYLRYFGPMLADRYEVEISRDFQTFDFVSVGPKGRIAKVVIYAEVDVENVYNLGFGDRELVTNYVSDVAVANNGDSQKVLATVAITLYTFTSHYPEAIVVATGTTPARTRLYQMGISNNLAATEEDFLVLGYVDEEWETFRKGVTYSSFLVRRKS